MVPPYPPTPKYRAFGIWKLINQLTSVECVENTYNPGKIVNEE
jgi:hypothetical protein